MPTRNKYVKPSIKTVETDNELLFRKGSTEIEIPAGAKGGTGDFETEEYE